MKKQPEQTEMGINTFYQEIGLQQYKEGSWVKNYERIKNQVTLAEH